MTYNVFSIHNVKKNVSISDAGLGDDICQRLAVV